MGTISNYLNTYIIQSRAAAMKSHYCRANTQKKYLIPEWRSKRLLYDFYVNDWCKTRNVHALSICNFHKETDLQNLGLCYPKKDQCAICALFKSDILPTLKRAHISHLEHQSKKEEAREEKEKIKLKKVSFLRLNCRRF